METGKVTKPETSAADPAAGEPIASGGPPVIFLRRIGYEVITDEGTRVASDVNKAAATKKAYEAAQKEADALKTRVKLIVIDGDGDSEYVRAFKPKK